MSLHANHSGPLNSSFQFQCQLHMKVSATPLQRIFVAAALVLLSLFRWKAKFEEVCLKFRHGHFLSHPFRCNKYDHHEISYLRLNNFHSYNQRSLYLQTGKGHYDPSSQKKKISSVLLQMRYLGGTRFRLSLFPVMTDVYCKLFLSHLRGMLKQII
jgi:hypothetical protein